MFKDELRKIIYVALKKSFVETKIKEPDIEIENVKNIRFGDLASNIGFVMAKEQNISPEDAAKKVSAYIIKNWPSSLSEVSYSGHQLGYLNFKYNYGYCLEHILEENLKFGNLNIFKNILIIKQFSS